MIESGKIFNYGANNAFKVINVYTMDNPKYPSAGINAKYADIKFIEPDVYGNEYIEKCVLLTKLNYPRNIKHYYFPTYPKSIYNKYGRGVAAIGNIRNSEIKAIRYNVTKEHDVWKYMIERCYDPTAKMYKNYGGIGVTVCKEWLVFEFFLCSLPLIPGYLDWINGDPNEYNIDKDMLQQGVPQGQKIYSPETVMFIKNSDNIRERSLRNISNFNNNYVGVAQNPSGKNRYTISLDLFKNNTSSGDHSIIFDDEYVAAQYTRYVLERNHAMPDTLNQVDISGVNMDYFRNHMVYDWKKQCKPSLFRVIAKDINEYGYMKYVK